MRKHLYTLMIFTLLILLGTLFYALLKGITPEHSTDRIPADIDEPVRKDGVKIKLPDAQMDGGLSLNDALNLQRSVGSLSNKPLSVENISQLLWSARGIQDDEDSETLGNDAIQHHFFIMVNNVEGILEGLYRYESVDNTMELIFERNAARELLKTLTTGARVNVDEAAVVILLCLDSLTLNRISENRSESFLFGRIGQVAQNMQLQSSALGLGTISSGFFSLKEVETVMHLYDNKMIIYFLMAGKIE
jgi:SagB-type dehydrogenase family enzyme